MGNNMIIALYDAVILPDVDYRMNIGSLSAEEKSRIKIDGNKAILLPLREMKERREIRAQDFYPLGVAADIIEISDSKMGTILHAHTREKVKVYDIATDSGVIEGEGRPVDEIMDITIDGEKKLLDTMKKTTTEVASNIRGGNYAIEYIKSIKTVNEFAAVFGQFFDMSPEEKYALLETNSFKQRGLLIHEALMRFKGTIDLQVDLANRDDPEANSYKKAAIHKQIGLLEKELEEMDPDEKAEEDDFEKKIEAAGMPEDVKKEALRVLRRFEQEPTNGAEYNTLYDYLDFITQLKWKPEAPEKIDLKKAKAILDRDHYGLEKVKERILQHLAVMQLNGKQNGSILLLVGAPGTGKTSMGKCIAEALGRKYVRISLGGIRDEAEIRGHRRTYIGALPGRIMEGIRRSGAMDPVVVLDEVDKIKSSFDGDPSAALLEVLDPEQNTTFTDHYVDLPYDLSHVFFICTANTWDTIPQPLLDRMEMIELPGYTPIEHFMIAKKHLVPQALSETGLTGDSLRFTDGALRKIISEYTMEAGVRGLKKQILSVCRKAAVKIVENEKDAEAGTDADKAKAAKTASDTEEVKTAGMPGSDGENAEVKPEAGEEDTAGKSAAGEMKDEDASANAEKEQDAQTEDKNNRKRTPIVIREKDVEDYLGHKKISHDKVLKDNPAGVVTGLAWTQAGGEILFIESVAMNGTGQIHLTGQIGDVMKESAETAVSLVKSTFLNGGLDFKDKDIHIHIPEGAVPKDGPSAGITMFTAVTSLVTGIPVSPYLAMTGEISLRGQVLPIGGLPEKLMAAERAGIRKVLIPKENVRDLEDVPEEIRGKLEIVPVQTVQEVIRQALHIRLPERDTHPFAAAGTSAAGAGAQSF